MSGQTGTHPPERTGIPRPGALSPLVDGLVVARRNLIKIKRVPDLLVFTTLSPIMFVLLFAYVFGGAIDQQGGGDAYREFLIAGIFAQTVVFGATITGAGLAEDVQKGIVDRFRTLPMSPSAVLTGRTLSDVVNNVIVLVVMSLTGLLVGWRIRGSLLDAVIGYGLLLVFAYAVSWIMAWVGLLVPTPEVVNNASFVIIFPLTFVANTFVPLQTLPGPLRAFAEWNPISAVTQAARDRFGNTDPTGRLDAGSWALQHPEVYTLAWAAVVLAVFVPLAGAQYRRSTSR
jgi:ABC-2 type transport system permease protein